VTTTHSISVNINGKTYTRDVEARMTLADFLRHEIGLTGTHLGCEHGVCGACTVLIDGRSGRNLTPVDGLSAARNHTPLQQAFQEHHGLQCGFCTSGILMSLTELLSDNPDPTEHEVREILTGHLCRCTGYAGPVRAALATAEHLKSIKGAA
jgi:carbon-monoxide dehydrogenase small subunit